MSILETAMEELKAIPPHKLPQAVSYLHSLRELSQAERVAALEASGGCLSPEEADEMEHALADCRRIDANEW